MKIQTCPSVCALITPMLREAKYRIVLYNMPTYDDNHGWVAQSHAVHNSQDDACQTNIVVNTF